jgi:UDP:flavonoid glycosyltransferase YjiC (YdhE family)
MGRERRFLVVTLDAAGNWPPERALIRELVKRGHDVRVVTDAAHAADLERTGARYRPYRHLPAHRERPTGSGETPAEERARIWREVFVNPLYCDELLAEAERERADVLLVDQMLLAAAAGAEGTGLPTAVLWHTVFASRPRGGPSPDLSTFSLDPVHEVRRRLGLDPVASIGALVARARAILAFTWAEFDAPLPAPVPALHYIGPLACLPAPPVPYAWPWPATDRRPLVLVSYSTSFQDQLPTLQRVADAVASLPARVLMTLGPSVSAADLSLPDNVVAESFVPHAAVLEHASLVVTHAGHGTVMAAVTAGVPLLCTPMGRDQFSVAACVERCRLGTVVPADSSPEALRIAIADALADPALRERARRFGRALDLQAGLRHALDVLESL